jgi:hypothetical protein
MMNGRPGLGSNGHVTREYKTQDGLIRFGVLPLLKSGEQAQVELFFNWDNRYGKADKVFVIDSVGSFVNFGDQRL